MRLSSLTRDVRGRLCNRWNRFWLSPSSVPATTVVTLEPDAVSLTPPSPLKDDPIIITTSIVEDVPNTRRKTVTFDIPHSEPSPVPTRAPPVPPFPVLLNPNVISNKHGNGEKAPEDSENNRESTKQQDKFPKMSLISKIFWMSMAALPLSGYAARTSDIGELRHMAVTEGGIEFLKDQCYFMAPGHAGFRPQLPSIGVLCDTSCCIAGNDSSAEDAYLKNMLISAGASH